MNQFTISVPGTVTFAANLLIVMFLLRMIAQKMAGNIVGQGLAALIH